MGSEAMSFGRDAHLIITMQHPQTTHTAAQKVGGKELCLLQSPSRQQNWDAREDQPSPLLVQGTLPHMMGRT